MSSEQSESSAAGSERRPRRNRDISVNSLATSEVWGIFIQLGVDINSDESIEQFARTIEWAEGRERRSRWWTEAKNKILLGCLLAACLGAGGAAIGWVTSHLFGTGR